MKGPCALLTATTVVALAIPATASAAKPGVAVSPATKITNVTAQLNGRVNPQSRPTTYLFQYGRTTRYGSVTPTQSAGSGGARDVAAAIGSLEPFTTYHYRVVASNPDGVTSSADRTFRTDRQPIVVSIGATPNPVPFGSPTTLVGRVSGTGAGAEQLQVQSKQFPFTSDFADVGNPIVSNPDGTYAAPIVGLTSNAEFRVVRTTGSNVRSADLLVGVAPQVRRAVSTTRPRRGRSVRFAGTVTPAFVPAQVAVQKRSSTGRWVVVGGTVTAALDASKSRYAVRVKVPRGGTYRVFVGNPDVARYAPSTSTEIRLRARR